MRNKSLFLAAVFVVLFLVFGLAQVVPAGAHNDDPGQEPPPRTLRWSLNPNGCFQTEDGEFYFSFNLQMFGGNKQGETFFWDAEDGSGHVTLFWNRGPSSAVITSTGRTLTVKVRQHRETVYNDAECPLPVGPHAPGIVVHTVAPAYLVAVLDAGDPIWSCNGSIVRDDNNDPIITLTETMYWKPLGTDISYSVLILSHYINPADCTALDPVTHTPLQGWYVDQPRFTCLAYLHEDVACPGVADFH